MQSRFAAALLSGAALFVLSAPALAIEPKQAADALAAALTGDTSAAATYADASQQGDDIVITGLSIKRGKDPDTMVFAQTTIEAPTEGEAGIFQSPRVTFSDGKLSGESAGRVGSATLTDVTVLDPKQVKGGAPAKGLLFSTAEASDIAVARGSQPGEVTIARVAVETGNVVDNVPQDSKGTVEDITIPAEVFTGGAFTPQAIGYEKLVVDVSWDGTNDVASKVLTVRDLTLAIQDGGDLTITGMLGNLPQPNQLNDADASAKAADMQVHNVTIAYDDNSLAGRVLDFMAKQQGVSRADYTAQISAAMPFLLSALNNPEFQNEVAGAVSTFLADPQSLTLKIEPETPLSATQIMEVMGSEPQTLPDRLNATITANSPN